MNMDQLCVLAVWFTNVLILIVLLFILVKLNRITEEKIKLETMQFNINYKPREKDFKIIDTLIQENLAQYCITNFDNPDKIYITEAIQNKMFEYILRKVMYQLSPIYLQKLYYIYNQDKLDEIITQKINQAILAYSIEVNGNYRN